MLSTAIKFTQFQGLLTLLALKYTAIQCTVQCLTNHCGIALPLHYTVTLLLPTVERFPTLYLITLHFTELNCKALHATALNYDVFHPTNDAFYATLEEILLTQHECVIMGDFNLPHIDWSLQRPTPAPGSKLLQFLADNGLSQHVQEPTRRNNILDLVITTEEALLVTL